MVANRQDNVDSVWNHLQGIGLAQNGKREHEEGGKEKRETQT